MLTHVVLFDPRPPFTPEELERFMTEMTAFAELPGVIESRVGKVIRGRPEEFAYAAVMRFEDMHDLTEVYIPHPRHMAFAPWIRERTEMHVFDFVEGEA